ncbi:MAG: arginine--tRNA ligase [Candidatus Kapaibacteriales bacterium]
MNMNYQDLFNLAKQKLGFDFEANFEEPNDPAHGDFSTNAALVNSKVLKSNPRNIAQTLVDKMNENDLSSYDVKEITIAGPGFINFSVTRDYYHKLLNNVIDSKEDFGKNESGKGNRAIVEYVSANPTGLLHIGHGRNAAIGDTIANLYEWNGYEVTKEYYFNNAGNQMNNLGKSIYARYIQLTKDKSYPLPENAYHGEYIITIAQDIVYQKGSEAYPYYNDINDIDDDTLTELRKIGEEKNFESIKKTLIALNVIQDEYYNEDSLYTSGKIDAVVEEFKQKGLAYEKDGAIWLKLSEMGLDEDRVIIKSSGEPTYRLPDIAYHKEKFERGFDVIIDVFGSDHIATIPDVMAGVSTLGYDKDKIKVVIHQFVTVFNDGQQVKMSKRTGKSYTLDDIIEEVGPEVTRFFFLMRSTGTHLEFDIKLAQEQNDKNPVFYLQYAHARISSIIRMSKQKGIDFQYGSGDTTLLVHQNEIELIKQLAKFEYVVSSAADKCETNIVTDYLRDTAAKFHAFYHDCKVISSDKELSKARLDLSYATSLVIKNGLRILGISAPEKM